MGRTRIAPAAAVALSLAAGVTACGGGAGGPPTLKYYSALDGAGTNVAQAKICSQQSGGKYNIEVTPLANSADASRELLVRRLAAKDSDIDMINMDVIWTPEFAAAGWLKPYTGAQRAQVANGQLPGPLKSVQWKGKIYAVPLNSNAQLLWYRKDLVKTPPKTWAQMIQMAKQLPASHGLIEEQGNKYEGYVVWFNTLVASAGGSIVNAAGKPTLGPPAVKAAQIIKDVATSGRADPALATYQEDQGRLAFEAGKAAFEINWPYVYAAARDDGKTNPTTKKVFQNMAWAPFPRVDANKPARTSLGGANIGVSVYGKNPPLATQAALCMASRRVQKLEAINEGLPPTFNSLYDDQKVRASYPFADLLRNALKVAVPRPATPVYSDVTLAVQDSLHPPAKLNPVQAIKTLRSRLNTVIDGGMY
jgi:trehalose/maltose transport system substrate-binding protein